MAEKRAISKGLWAPIHTPDRGHPWINWQCVKTTRKAAQEALLEHVAPKYHRSFLSGVRFARVTISEDDHG